MLWVMEKCRSVKNDFHTQSAIIRGEGKGLRLGRKKSVKTSRSRPTFTFAQMILSSFSLQQAVSQEAYWECFT